MNINRIAVFYLLFVLLGIVAVWRIIDFQFIHKPEKDTVARTSKEIVIPCKRGSILSSDGRFLAFSIPEYKIYLDCTQAPDSLYDNHLGALSDSLASLLHDRSAGEYRKLIREGRAKERQYLCLTKDNVTYQQMKRICTFPILNKGRLGSGRIIETYNIRQYPYGTLAYRALGQLKNDGSKVVGIEASCDSILKGTNGVMAIKKTEHNRWIEDMDGTSYDPVDGLDVRTTIDINVQEIAEKAMRHQLAKSNDIKYGTVIVMETATGRIRAMVNLNKGDDGEYHESYNYAIAGTGEPGSVFKLATLTLLLDEGKTTLDHVIDPAPRVIQCGKAAPMRDEYLNKYTEISVLRGFEISSNNVFRKLAWDNYSTKPTEFVDKLNDKIRISYNFDFDIEGLGHAHIKHPSEKNSKGQKTWSDSDLPQIAMGYTSRLAPLHTINFYNAIANGGMMVRPRLIESFEKDGIVVKDFEVEKIGRVCSEKTAKELHRAMRSVVLEGTGKVVFDGCKVEVAGKTGTARVAYGKGNTLKQHQATFAGFFPYEKPQYTVIAVIYSNPSNKNYYGATWGGPVVREIAEELYSCNPQWGEHIKASAKMPVPVGGGLRETILMEEESSDIDSLNNETQIIL